MKKIESKISTKINTKKTPKIAKKKPTLSKNKLENTVVKKKRKNDEDKLQIKCIEYMRKNYPTIITRSTLSGAHIGAKQGFKRKEMGNLAGFPDLEILEKSNDYGALYIELKTKKGRLSQFQKDVIHKLNEKGYLALKVDDFELFKKTVKDYLNKK